MLTYARAQTLGAATTVCTPEYTNELQDISDSVNKCLATPSTSSCDVIDSPAPMWASGDSNYSGPVNRFTFYADLANRGLLCPAERYSLLMSALHVILSWAGPKSADARLRALEAIKTSWQADPSLTMFQLSLTLLARMDNSDELMLGILNAIMQVVVPQPGGSFGSTIPKSIMNYAITSVHAISADPALSSDVRQTAVAVYQRLEPFKGLPEYEPIVSTPRLVIDALGQSPTKKIIIATVIFVGVAGFTALIAHQAHARHGLHGRVRSRRRARN